MRSKFIITIAVIAVVASMVFYKQHHDQKEQHRRDSQKGSKSSDQHRWDVN